MRRDIVLAGMAGIIVGSWLTLIGVQVEEHGVPLPGGQNVRTEAKNHPAPPVATTEPKPPEKTEPAPTATNPAPAATSPAPPPAVVAQATAVPSPVLTAPAVDTPPANETTSSVTPKTPSPTATPTPAAMPTSTPESTAKAVIAESASQTAGNTSAGTPPANPPAPVPQEKPQPAAAQPIPPQADTAPVDTAQAGSTRANPVQNIPIPTKRPTPDKAEPAEAPIEQAALGEEEAGQMPADQADRERAAALHEVAPKPPASEQASLGGQPASPDDPAKPVELVRPFSDRAGVLTIAGKRVQLPGVVPMDINRTCIGSDGKVWPCGTMARTAFRMFLRGRTIDCDLPSPTWEGTVTGACRYARVDLSDWLVRNGWAEPDAGSPLVAVADEARQEKRGIYGDDPRKTGKSTLAPTPPKEDPLNPI